MAQENRNHATNAVPAQDVSAGSFKSASIVSQPRRTARFDSRRTLAHRAIVRELDEWFGVFAYPDPMVAYAATPSREALDD